MDAGRLAFADFDHVLCAFAIFPRPEVVLAEWHRVLRPGGGVSVAGRRDERWRWYEERLLAYHEEHGLPLNPASGGLQQPIETALAESGFASVRVMEEFQAEVLEEVGRMGGLAVRARGGG